MVAVSSQSQNQSQTAIAVAFSRGLRAIRHVEKLVGVDQVLSPSQAKTQSEDVSYVLVWGRKSNTAAALRYAQEHQLDVVYLEDGWIRSSAADPHSRISYSLLKDRTGVYYDSSVPCDLENLLNLESNAFRTIATDEQLAYAARCREQLVASNITKYNFTSDCKFSSSRACTPLTGTSPESKKQVLVVDQTRDDASVRYGAMDADGFEAMLHAAIKENNDAEIIVKVHPDVISGRREGYLSDLACELGVRLYSDSVNPMRLLKHIDKVYVGTSQLGYEALLCGKPVVVFGQPFYSGWGLTDDRNPVARRTRKRSIDDLFFATHIALATYCNPVTGVSWQLHECLEHVELQQRMFTRNAHHFDCVGITTWKQKYIRQYLRSPDGSVSFGRNRGNKRKSHEHRTDGDVHGEQPRATARLTWGYRAFSDVKPTESQADNGLPVFRLEDGFLRSSGLGSDFNAPASLVVDGLGMYFDPARPSELEALLSQHDCTPAEIFRAVSLKKLILSSRLSKYNVGTKSNLLLPAPDKVHVLVVGQVEDDESIRRGCDGIRKNADLLIAVRKAMPDAWIRYKPHPDVVAGNRKGAIEKSVLDENANAVDADASIVDCIEVCDELHTMTSLSGFEALLRGKRVVTYGTPFYAGWGLTEDHQPNERRTRRRTLDELVYLSLIAYPRYVDIDTGEFTTPEDLVQTIKNRIAMNKHISGKWSLRQINKVVNIVKGLRYAP